MRIKLSFSIVVYSPKTDRILSNLIIILYFTDPCMYLPRGLDGGVEKAGHDLPKTEFKITRK